MIVDENGKPFKPSAFANARMVISSYRKKKLLEQAEPSEFETMQKIRLLRESCGVSDAPKTIKFRRHSPFK